MVAKEKTSRACKAYDVMNCANRNPAVIKQAIISLQGMAEFKSLYLYHVVMFVSSITYNVTSLDG